MRITIKTTFSGPTDTRGARITAKGAGKQASVSYPYQLSASEAHKPAAIALCERLAVDPSGLRCTADHKRGYVFEVEG